MDDNEDDDVPDKVAWRGRKDRNECESGVKVERIEFFGSDLIPKTKLDEIEEEMKDSSARQHDRAFSFT